MVTEIIDAQTTDEPKATTPYMAYDQVRTFLLERKEIALIDVREEAVFAEAHPLFAANLPLSRLEIEAYERIPRRNTPLVVYDNGEGLAQKAVYRFNRLGYTEVYLLKGGLEGWRVAGGEIFRDVNSPSKAFGEWVESKRHTPSLSAPEVKTLLASETDVVVVDARRFDEYQTMNIPGSTSVPGAELVLRIRALAPDPKTTVIVNCAGRTRSIIGTQSLINAGIPNRVFALRNGTIGWTLAGQALDHGQNRRFSAVNKEIEHTALADSRKVAERARVKRTTLDEVHEWLNDTHRTTYCFDVRTIEEYRVGHLPRFKFSEGGQLVQETDHFVPIRGARIVLADNLEVRANMTASWLAQMGWEVYVLDGVSLPDFTATEAFSAPLTPPELQELLPAFRIEPFTLAHWLQRNENVVVVDFSPANQYAKKHIPTAYYVMRSQLESAWPQLPTAMRYVLTSPDSVLAEYVFAEFRSLTQKEVFVLKGGNQAWIREGLEVESGDIPENNRFISPPIDRYQRPYEGTQNPVKAMQEYLEWEYGLVEQLERDGTHGFDVI